MEFTSDNSLICSPEPNEIRGKSSVGYWLDRKCPKCGCQLLGNDFEEVWCSFVGDRNTPGCNYGLEKFI